MPPLNRLEQFASAPTVSPLLVQSGNSPWAQRYSQELKDVVLRYAARLPRNVRQIHRAVDLLVVRRAGADLLARLRVPKAYGLVPPAPGEDARMNVTSEIRACFQNRARARCECIPRSCSLTACVKMSPVKIMVLRWHVMCTKLLNSAYEV